jgi:hypothetical protein
MLAAACTGVVFLAGGKLLDSVRKPQPAIIAGPSPSALRTRAISGRNRPRRLPMGRAAASRISRRRG